MIRQLLERSDRLTLMTSYELQYTDVGLRPLPVAPIMPVPSIGIMTRAGWLPTALHVDFLDLVRAQIAAHPAPLRSVS